MEKIKKPSILIRIGLSDNKRLAIIAINFFEFWVGKNKIALPCFANQMKTQKLLGRTGTNTTSSFPMTKILNKSIIVKSTIIDKQKTSNYCQKFLTAIKQRRLTQSLEFLEEIGIDGDLASFTIKHFNTLVRGVDNE